MARKRINVITLGCSKNLVDSERILKMFEQVGFEACHEAKIGRGDIVVVNTCGFIGDAKEESINTILEYANAKKARKISALYVMGCLSQRYEQELPAEIPEVDGWYGKFNWPQLVSDLSNKYPAVSNYDRVITTPSHYAYIKIAEGCNRFCAFCAIPIITGRYASRPIEEILSEVKSLVTRGVKEFNVIAQDLSSYGIDIYGEMRLAELVDRMSDIEGVEWIRLHYAYPAQFPLDILDVMARKKNVCKYLDIALQHSSDVVLNNMRRHINKAETETLLSEIRSKVPGIHIRTTLMVGYPGEGDTEFEELKAFVKEQRFERMGAFAYCEEEDTYGAQHFEDDIPSETKRSRLDELMKIQEKISLECNEAKVGKTLRVIVDREEDEYYIGRTEWDSPEVDQEVLIRKNSKLEKGTFYNVTIIQALPFDLIAEVAK